MNLEINANRYRNVYEDFIGQRIKDSIGSKSVCSSYRKKFLEYYKNSNNEIRIFLRTFVFNKVKEYKLLVENLGDKIESKTKKELEIFETLLSEILSIKRIV